MPFRKVKFNKYRHKKSDWMNNDTLDLIKKRDRLYYKLQLSKSDTEYNSLYNELNSYKKEIRGLIRKSKRDYYANQFLLNKNDIKRSWGVLRSALNKKQQNKFPSEFKYKNNIITDDDTIAEAFN